MALSYAELRALSDEDIERLHDEKAESTVVGLGWYRDEIHRRMIERQGNLLGRLTWVIAGLTLLNVILVAATLIK